MPLKDTKISFDNHCLFKIIVNNVHNFCNINSNYILRGYVEISIYIKYSSLIKEEFMNETYADYRYNKKINSAFISENNNFNNEKFNLNLIKAYHFDHSKGQYFKLKKLRKYFLKDFDMRNT